MRPTEWPTPKQPATVWLDYAAGTGVDDAGSSVKPLIGGRRQKPQLVDLLETARHHSATRLMLTGPVPSAEPGARHWLIVATEGWTADPRGHWLGEPATGRFVHDVTGSRVEVRLAREWFGETVDSPRDALQAWDLTRTVIAGSCNGAGMLLSPAGTGQNIWAKSLPKKWDGAQIDADVDQLIRSTSGQHRQEHLAGTISGGPHDDCLPLISADKIDGFGYVDGRFMYSALGKELGTAPARMLTAPQAEELANDPYARARYHVRFTVPDGWDTLGILGVKRDDLPGEHWMYPNRPGAVGQTWCDAAEAHVAMLAGWRVEFLEAIEFTKARPLDTFLKWLRSALDAARALEVDAAIRAAVAAALRMVVLQTIGAFHSRGRERTVVVNSALDLPPDARPDKVVRHGDLYVYRKPAGEAANARLEAFQHAELSAQIWGRGRARVLYSPIAPMTLRPDDMYINYLQPENATEKDAAGAAFSGRPVRRAGALFLPPDSLIGINGDAVYTTYVPRWAMPTEQGGGDDGNAGRLRLQGYLPGPLSTPTSTEARNRLRKRAEAEGTAQVPDEAVRW